MLYKTGQRKLLYDFFCARPHELFSVKDITAALPDGAISVSAIYRNLAVMTDEGILRRSIKSGSRDALYQFADGSHCRDTIHLTCVDCGKVFHLSKTVADIMQDELAEADGFRLNKAKTILYGTCKNCVGHP